MGAKLHIKHQSVNGSFRKQSVHTISVAAERSKVSSIHSILNSSVVCLVRRCGGRMRYAPTFLPLIR